MAKKEKPSDLVDVDAVQKALEPLSKGLKVAVSELYSVFVRQYVVKGFSELFTAILLVVIAYFLAPSVHYWALIPLAVSVYLVYDVIHLLGNPKYFALEDIAKKVRQFDGKHK